MSRFPTPIPRGYGFRPISDDAGFDADVLAYWCAGHDTKAIAALVGQPESVVANRLPKILEDHRRRSLRDAAGAA